MEILPGIHLIKGYSNTYIVELEKENVLIDAGIWWETNKIIKTIKKELSDPQISKILITHAHPDHIEGVPKLVEEFGSEVYVHEADQPIIKGETKYVPPKSPKLLWKFLYLFLKQPKIDNVLSFNELPPDFPLKPIHLPGHTPGTTVFYYETMKVLFSGDLIVTKRKYPQLPPSKYNWDDQMTVDSGKKILELDFEILMPGHGDPIFKNAKKKILKSPILFSELYKYV